MGTKIGLVHLIETTKKKIKINIGTEKTTGFLKKEKKKKADKDSINNKKKHIQIMLFCYFT